MSSYQNCVGLSCSIAGRTLLQGLCYGAPGPHKPRRGKKKLGEKAQKHWDMLFLVRKEHVQIQSTMHGPIVTSTRGLVAMTSASHAEGRQFDPGRV